MTEQLFMNRDRSEFRAPVAPRPIDAGVAMATLRALSAMARLSQRHQAEVGVALHRAGLTFDGNTQSAILRHLGELGFVDNFIPISDGAMLLTVTATGMSQAGIG